MSIINNNAEVHGGMNGARRNSFTLVALMGVVLCSLLLAVTATTASAAPFGIEPGSFVADAFKADGTTPETQAAAVPYVAVTRFTLTKREDGINLAAQMRNVDVNLPKGLVINPEAAPKCSRADFDGMVGGTNQCPAASQVGVARVVATSNPNYAFRPAVYNVVPKPGQTADFGFVIATVPVHISGTVDAGREYALTANIEETSQALPVISSEVAMWGVPGDPSHDEQRACGVVDIPVPPVFFPCTNRGDRTPFVVNPSPCGADGASSIRLDSWLHPGVFATASYTPANPISGCERLKFRPAVQISTSTSAPDAPTGVNVDFDFPQNTDPDALGTPPLRTATVTFPEGMSINPASAGGLEACTDAQLGLGSDSPVGCPDAAKIGTVTAVTPVLAKPLNGSVYLRTQASDDPESGQMFRLALVLSQPERGLLLKIPGSVKVNARTGQVTTEFADNPQTPVSSLTLSMKPGSRAALATPVACGRPEVQTSLSSWGGQSAAFSSPVDVSCTPGLGGFSPSFQAGTQTPVAGAFSPFNLSIVKPDGDAAVTGLSMVFPTGLLAQLKGNVGQQVGTVKAFTGPGANPYMLPGQAFLEGPYGDAPFSLRVVVPAKAGPFDLGEVVVRQKIYVNPESAQVTVVSDPIPTIVKGVPARLQRLDVNVDKPGFMINPTSCAAKEIKGTLASVAGQTAALTNRFQVGECGSLGYEPKLSMTMTGKGQTKDGSHPALKAHLAPPVGDANTKKTTVTLPLALALDPGNANGLCEPKDAAANKCPANTIVGSAEAQSILPDTLKGPVYFVRGERVDGKGKVRKTLPKLFIPLSANGVTVYVHASSDVEDDRLVTTFDNLPDAPFSSFDLNINGGEHGILAVSNTNTCAATNVADAEFGGQNGKTYASKVTMGTPCALGVVKSSHTSTVLKLTVGGLGAGKVSASGNGVTKSSRSLTSATTATLTLKLATATRRTLAHGGDVKVKVKVAFTARGQKKAKTATKTITIHGAKKR